MSENNCLSHSANASVSRTVCILNGAIFERTDTGNSYIIAVAVALSDTPHSRFIHRHSFLIRKGRFLQEVP